MITISKIELTCLNDNFVKFKQQVTYRKQPPPSYFVSQISKFEKQYKKAGLEKSFAQNLFVFAEQMRKSNIAELPGIIFSHLLKLPFIKPHVKELYATKALAYAKEQGDLVHILARMVDLEKLYKQSGNSHKYARILFSKEKILSAICNDYKTAMSNYHTHSRRISPLKKYEMELAKTRVDIAKIIMKSNPEQAKVLLIKALKVFKRENRTKESDFVKLMLSQCP